MFSQQTAPWSLVDNLCLPQDMFGEKTKNVIYELYIPYKLITYQYCLTRFLDLV